MPSGSSTEAWGLLRLLLLWVEPMPAPARRGGLRPRTGSPARHLDPIPRRRIPSRQAPAWSSPRRIGWRISDAVEGRSDSPSADRVRLRALGTRSSGAIANRGPVRSAVGAPDQLANFDQVPVRVAHITADLAATVDRRGQKLRSAGAPLLIDGADVGDADVQEARGVIWIRGRHERHGGLVVCGASADTDGDPAVRQGDN